MSKLNIAIVCLFLLSVFTCAIAQTPQWSWAQKVGGTGDDQGNVIATDNQGNIYIAGWFTGQALIGNVNLTATGSMDMYIAKLTNNGSWVWIKQVGGSGSCEPFDIAFDSDSNIYICGAFTSTANFGLTSLTSAGDNDIFITKLTSEGEWVWSIRSGGVNSDVAKGIDIDDSDNVYLAGEFWNTTTIGHVVLTNPSYSQVFVAKLHPDGSWLWAIQAGGNDFDYCNGMTLDANSNICLTGTFSQTATFGDFTLTSAGSRDIYIGKLNQDGVWLWISNAGESSSDYAHSITTDNLGNVYLAGKCSWYSVFGDITIDFGGGFVAKLDNTNTWQWVKKVNGDGTFNYNINADSYNNVLVTGSFSGVPYFGNTMLIPNAGQDIFAAKIDPSGNWVWAIAAGSNSDDGGSSITYDNSGNVFITGTMKNVCGFNTISLTSSGLKDVFLAKITVNTPNEDDVVNPQITDIQLNNYPNPFTVSTKVSVINSTNKLNCELTIYDVKGRKVNTLFKGILSKGNHSMVWNGKDDNMKDLPSGIYYCTLVSGKYLKTEKMVLFR